jgi:hypothetical protein
MSDLRKDFMGHVLCNPCWNMQHYDKEKNKEGKSTGFRFSKCLRGGCECDCIRVLYAEAFERGKKHLLDKVNASNPFRQERRHYYYAGYQGKTFPEAEALHANGKILDSAKPVEAVQNA